jgi:hypothetical protein
VGEKRSRKQYLHDPEHDVHDTLPFLSNTSNKASPNRQAPDPASALLIQQETAGLAILQGMDVAR